VGEGKPVAPSFLLACVLWADVREGWQARTANMPLFPALQAAIEEVFNARIGDVSGRGKLAGDMREIWTMQPRFEKRSGSAPFGLVEQPRFRAAFDFMCLRAEAGEVEVELADWWEDFSLADDESRIALLQAVKPAARAVRADGQAKKRPRRRRKPSASSSESSDQA
jgi:poly(A) polymerase